MEKTLGRNKEAVASFWISILFLVASFLLIAFDDMFYGDSAQYDLVVSFERFFITWVLKIVIIVGIVLNVKAIRKIKKGEGTGWAYVIISLILNTLFALYQFSIYFFRFLTILD